MDEKKKFILITGASSGIGKAISIGLSFKYNIVLNGRDVDRLVQTKKECSTDYEQIIFPLDLSNIERLEGNISSFIQENNVEINHYIHCAGYMKMVPLKMITLDTINSMFSSNTFSAAFIIKVLNSRRYNNSTLKSVVLISSNISNFGAKAFSVYGASKAALDGFMRSLAIELAPKVRINSVLPGPVRTKMTEAIFTDKETIKRMETNYPLGLGETDDILGIVEFLLSEKAKWITGQQFTVDGGRTINISG